MEARMPTSRSRLGIIFFTVFIDLVGFGIVLPILPYYAQHFGARGLLFGMLVGAYSGMQFLATAVLGRLSDRVVRRPFLPPTMVISAAGSVLFALAGSYRVLFVARLVSGFAGGNISAAQAYVADVTTPAERSKGMGIVGAAFGLGFIVGPALGGLAAHYGGHLAPGLVAAGLSLLNFCSAYAILPESLKEEHRVTRELFDFGHLAEALTHPRVAPLMIAWGLIPLAFSGYTGAPPLYTAARFGWREKELGWFFTVVGITAAVVQGYLFPKLSRRVGDRALVIAGTFAMAAAVAVVPYLDTAAALYGWAILLAFRNSVVSPPATGAISGVRPPTPQGAMLGAAQSLAALGRPTRPELGGVPSDRFSPLWAFLAAGVVMAMAAGATLRLPGGKPEAGPAA